MKRLQRHGTLPDYCNLSAAANAVAGKDILLMIYDDNANLLAVAGQRSLTINRSADQIEVSSKDTEGGWKSSIAGMKEWSIDTDGLYIASDASMTKLSNAFNNSDQVCLVVKNIKTGRPMFGGQAAITDFPLEAPYDDALTYSITLSGNGALVDLATVYADPDHLTVQELTSGNASVTTTLVGYKGTLVADPDDLTRHLLFSFDGPTLTITVEPGAFSDDPAPYIVIEDRKPGTSEKYGECGIYLTILEPGV